MHVNRSPRIFLIRMFFQSEKSVGTGNDNQANRTTEDVDISDNDDVDSSSGFNISSWTKCRI